jgi:hypothetical protein
MHHFSLLSSLSRRALVIGALFFTYPTLAQAGCGCDKPPPAAAAVRPNVTYAGSDVTLFHSAFQPGQTYTVTFTSGVTGNSESVSEQAVSRRDIAGGQYKSQLVVTVPELPLGPTSISVHQAGQNSAMMAVSDAAFTIAPQPVVVPAQHGQYHFRNFQAAVSRQGVVYISLDLTNVTDPQVFQAQANGYPLHFDADSVVFYNTQGYLMQMLNQGIPGLATINSADKANQSDLLQYARHEFNSFFLAHQERQAHAVDSTNPDWHADGTPHVDHNHLILAIVGQMTAEAKKGDDNKDGLPDAGATPKFELRLTTSSLFSSALLGKEAVDLSGSAITDGDVQSNGIVTISDDALVNGDATGAAVNVRGRGHAMSTGHGNKPGDLLPVYMPNLLTDLGSVNLTGSQSLTLEPGAYKASDLVLRGNSQLIINNANEAVTLYVTGLVEVSGNAQILATETRGPEDFSLYVQGSGNVTIVGNGTFSGLVYAPHSVVDLSGQGDFYGAFVGKTVKVGGAVAVHYDTSSAVVKAKKAKASKKPKKIK